MRLCINIYSINININHKWLVIFNILHNILYDQNNITLPLGYILRTEIHRKWYNW